LCAFARFVRFLGLETGLHFSLKALYSARFPSGKPARTFPENAPDLRVAIQVDNVWAVRPSSKA